MRGSHALLPTQSGTAFRRALATIILLGVALAFAVAFEVWQEGRTDVALKFQEEARTRFAIVARELESQLYLMQACRAFYAGSQEVERDEFRTFARLMLQKIHTVHALAWVPLVPGEQRAGWEQAARRSGLKDFEIKERNREGNLVRAGMRSEYFPAFYCEPESPDRAILGYDLASDLPRRLAMMAARDSQEIRVSARVALIREKDEPQGCLLFAPIYRQDALAVSARSEPQVLKGYVLGVLHFADVFEPVLKELKPAGLEIEIRDESAPPGGQILFGYASRLPRQGQGKSRSTLEYMRRFSFAGRTWSVRCVPAPGYFESGPGLLPGVVLVCGGGITGLIAVFLQSLFRQGRRVQQMVEERTAQLVHANRGLEEEIQARAKVELRLGASLSEKEVLLREVHHRVKNNLQVISSLLQLQTSHLTDPTSLKLAKDMRNRVRSIALVYEKLHGLEASAKIDFPEYVRSLMRDLARSYRGKREGVAVELEIEPVLLNLDTAIPCGLIVNELAANALKYAFPDETGPVPANGRSGVITIKFQAAPEQQLVLVVADNGIGLPAHLGLESTDTLGLQIVNILVEQLNGTIALDRQGGTRFTITFRELVYKQRN